MKFDPEEAENQILAITGVASDHIGEGFLMAMTASDITMQSLDYLEHIEVIRPKCGRLQGRLSGEIKKRIAGLEEMIRALQFKAESKNDPEFLKHKIGELTDEIRKYKREEEKRTSEVRELREIIAELKKENKETREELRRVREEVRKNSEEKTDDRKEGGKEESSCKKDTYKLPEVSRVQNETRSRSPSVVRRPPLKGQSVVIPESLKQTKENRLDTVNRQIEALIRARAMIHKAKVVEDMDVDISYDRDKKDPLPLPQRKPWIIVKQNIQVAPPFSEREAAKAEKIRKKKE